MHSQARNYDSRVWLSLASDLEMISVAARSAGKLSTTTAQTIGSAIL